MAGVEVLSPEEQVVLGSFDLLLFTLSLCVFIRWLFVLHLDVKTKVYLGTQIVIMVVANFIIINLCHIVIDG